MLRRGADRGGMTLVELLVGMTVSAIALAMLTLIVLRQQRIVADLADDHALTIQLRDAATTLPIDLSAVTPRLGDIREARDTALELRTTIASAVVCDTTSAGGVILAPVSPTASLTSITSSLADGDSLWLLTFAGDTDRWTPSRVTNASTVGAGDCGADGPLLSADLHAAPRTSLTLSPPPSALPGTPLRITRPVRYSIYRASDGGWYVGERDWSSTTSRFNTIQPIAGPFLAANATRPGLNLRYLDSAGADIPSPVADTRSIAAIRIALRGQTRGARRVLASASPGSPQVGPRQDSSIVFATLRNRW